MHPLHARMVRAVPTPLCMAMFSSVGGSGGAHEFLQSRNSRFGGDLTAEQSASIDYQLMGTGPLLRGHVTRLVVIGGDGLSKLVIKVHIQREAPGRHAHAPSDPSAPHVPSHETANCVADEALQVDVCVSPMALGTLAHHVLLFVE